MVMPEAIMIISTIIPERIPSELIIIAAVEKPLPVVFESGLEMDTFAIIPRISAISQNIGKKASTNDAIARPLVVFGCPAFFSGAGWISEGFG